MRILLLLPIVLMLFSCEKGYTPEQQLNADIEKIREYLDDRNLVAESTPSGLHYIIHEPGSGGHPTLSSNIQVLYVGKLLKNGEVFDQTDGAPRTFQLSKTIEGWREGIPLLQKGGKATLLLPSVLGYGPYGAGSIPGNAPLLFEVELVDF